MPTPPAIRLSPTALRVWMWLIFLIYFAACLHEAFGPFVIGHDGFNGAAFSQAARNSLRFGIPQQVQYYTDFTAPPLADVYTNHPLLLHGHLIAVLGLGGVEPWIARLIPIAYALGFFILLYRVTARRAGALTATIAVTIWTLTPLHTIFANMVNHEQGGLFWCFFLVDRYLQYQSDVSATLAPLDPETSPARRPRQWPIFLAVSCAMQFDWVGYYFAFFIGLHALVRAVAVNDGRTLLRRVGFTVRFSAVVIANAALFFGWIAWLRGGLSAMGAAFNQRSHSPDGYAKLVFERSTDLYGLGFIALLGIWLVYASVRIARRRATAIDFIPWTFFAAQLIHSLVFKSAGAIHSYWTIYAGPALAVGGAMVLVAGMTAVARLFMRRGEATRWATLVPTALILVGTIAQAKYALAQHLWGHDNHRGSYLDNVSDEWFETQWSRLLHDRFGREGTCYLVHPSADRTVQVMYYLDAQRRDGTRALMTQGYRPPEDPLCARDILLVDLSRTNTQENERVVDLVRTHPTLVVDRRFVAITLHDDSAEPLVAAKDAGPPIFEALLMSPQDAPWWWRWLVNTRNPPFHLEPDPDAAWLTDGGLIAWGPTTDPHWAGGRGGRTQELRCPEGAIVTAIEVHVETTTVAGLGLECAVVPGALVDPTGSDDAPQCVEGRFTGTWVAARHTAISCPDGAHMHGFRGRAAALVDALGPLCLVPTRAGSKRNQRTSLLARTARIEGGAGGTRFDLPCGDGERLVGATVRAGALVDAISPICEAAPLVSTP